MNRKAKAAALRQLVNLLTELAGVVDFNNGLHEAVNAWEREYEVLRLLSEYVRCNETARTKERSVEILKSSGFYKQRENDLLSELGY